MSAERLQKIMAASGLGSRRACEGIIEAGRVRVNGVIAKIGMSADPSQDDIRVDGSRLKPPSSFRTFAVYKPRGVVSSLTAQGERATVRDLLPISGRFYPVGRLDIESEGLMLLTNDGTLTQRVTHPRFETEKEYRVLVARRPTPEQLSIWERGVVLADGFHTGKATLRVERPFGKGAWIRVVMREGHKHEIRDIGMRLGLPVVRIQRIRMGTVIVGRMKPGEWRELSEDEVRSVQGITSMPAPVRVTRKRTYTDPPRKKISGKPRR